MATPCATVPLVDRLDDIEDPRVERDRLHSLHGILVTTILAVICGADFWTDVEFFGCNKHDWLSTFLRYPLARHLWSGLCPVGSGRIGMLLQSLAARLPGEVVAINGKSARRSRDLWLGEPALHVVSAWTAEAQLVQGQRKTDTQSNLTAVPTPSPRQWARTTVASRPAVVGRSTTRATGGKSISTGPGPASAA